MQTVVEDKATVDASTIYAMRCDGATLGQIADKIGRTKERVRQILINNYGSAKHGLISTTKLCKLSGLYWTQIIELYQNSVITPAWEWDTGTGHRSLWSQAVLEQIKLYFRIRTKTFCRICHCPVPADRRHYCSERCYKESNKYKYRSVEARHRHLISVKKYRESRKRLTALAACRQVKPE